MDARNDESSFLREQPYIDGASSGEQEVAPKKYHRHTPDQIQELENFFKECPQPDKNQTIALSTRLGLEIRQVKFWFQNKRTQLKTQFERHENGFLKEQNKKLEAENELLKHAYANRLCHNCGSIALHAPVSFEHEKLRFENAELKRQLQLISSILDKFSNNSAASSSASNL